MGFPEVLGHAEGVVKVGKGGFRVVGAGIQNALRGGLNGLFLFISYLQWPGEMIVDNFS